VLTSKLEKVLKREQWRHQLFPSLLLVVQELSTWKARAVAMNAAGLTTFHGKPWTRSNVHKQFQSYWLENNGQYSWNQHKNKLEQLEKIVA